MDYYHQYMYSYPHKRDYYPLEDITFDNLSISKTSDLYIHIPFCSSKCGYCNLFSCVQKDLIDDYTSAVQNHADQISAYTSGVTFSEFVLGGGTPLILSEKNLNHLFESVEDVFHLNIGEVYTVCETSPLETTPEKLDILKDHQVNRVSIGVQSFFDDELIWLRRHHDTRSVVEALELIRQRDFETLNIDLIYGMQGQTKERFIDSIKKALAYEPEEVFLYPLYIRQSSPLKRPQDDSRYLLYQAGRQYLMEQGYQPLSMRRFVQRGDQLVSSCGFSDTISLGCGGRSYIGNTHFCTNYSTNEATIERTIKSFIDQSDKTQITNGYVLNEHEMKNRFVLKNLFFSTGISEGEYQSQFASSLKDDFPILDTWGRKAFLTASNGSYNLTDLGFSLSDYLGPQLVEVK